LSPGKATGLGLERYTSSRQRDWDAFVERSKNGTFLFQRGYMDYHADRFEDHSLMAFQGGRLIALLPANRAGDALVSHGGLTYGGWITDERMRTATMLELFALLRDEAATLGVGRVIYKPVPAIYQRMPAEEDLYALFRHGARLVRRDVSSALRLSERPALTKGRKCGLKLARSQGLDVRRSDDIEAFMEVEAALLREKYGTRPTHTVAEMRLLAERFPNNIKLFAAYRDVQMLGGVLVYESVNVALSLRERTAASPLAEREGYITSNRVAHAQYIASTGEGRAAAALDAVLDHLLNVVYRDSTYFDFGISTEDEGRYLNEGLSENKESYGARAIVYDRYEMSVEPRDAAAPVVATRAAAATDRAAGGLQGPHFAPHS